MRTLVFAVLIMATIQGVAQRACLTQAYAEQQQALHPSYGASRVAVEAFSKQQVTQAAT